MDEDTARLKIKKIKKKWSKCVSKSNHEGMLSFFYNHQTKHISEYYRHRGIEMSLVIKHIRRMERLAQE